jgi:putative Holliday junction resolvase
VRALALDYGPARCGAAVSDATGTLATPIEPIERPDSGEGLRRIAELVSEREVEAVVVGLPLTLSGGESDQTGQAREFAARVAAVVAPVPVRLHDERLTTAQAQRTGGRADEHSRAAAHLLEAWLAGGR